MTAEPTRIDAIDQDQLMVRVAHLYYEEMLTQEAIARRLNLTRWKIGRLLRAAREQGIVEISIRHVDLRLAEMETALQERFNLRHVVVTASGGGNQRASLSSVARAAARFLAKLDPVPTLLATSWGKTMTAVAEAIPDGWTHNIHVVQMNGALTLGIVKGQQTDPAYQISRTGHGRCTMLPVPAIVDQPAVREGLERDSTIEHVLNVARSAPVALFGIGLLNEDSVLAQSGYLDPTQVAKLRATGAVGDVIGRFISTDGRIVDEQLDRRTLGLSLDELAAKDERIAVAHGAHKMPPTLGALRAGLITSLIVDEDLGQAMVTYA
ncbi:MAG: sugar-binding transcriptional regulator [Candidatus Nanopelagicales bacterium]|jgi:deoxyribonucleoside regulator